MAKSTNDLGSISYQPGDQLYGEGDSADSVFFVQSGTVRLSRVVASQSVTVELVSKGEFFGDASILAGQSRTATAVALTPVEVLKIDSQRFENMVQSNPGIAIRMVKQLSSRLAQAQFRLANFSLRSNVGRLLGQLRYESEIRDPTGKNGAPIPNDLAEILGIEIAEAKHILYQLVQDELISINETGFFFINDKEAFVRYLNYLELKDRFQFRD